MWPPGSGRLRTNSLLSASTDHRNRPTHSGMAGGSPRHYCGTRTRSVTPVPFAPAGDHTTTHVAHRCCPRPVVGGSSRSGVGQLVAAALVGGRPADITGSRGTLMEWAMVRAWAALPKRGMGHRSRWPRRRCGRRLRARALPRSQVIVPDQVMDGAYRPAAYVWEAWVHGSH